MAKPYSRTQRIEPLIQRLMGDFLLRHFTEKKWGTLTVTKVKISPDLKEVFLSISQMGGELEKEEVMRALRKKKWDFRAILAKKLCSRNIPKVYLKSDTSFEEGFRIVSLLNEIKKDPSSATEAAANEETAL